MLKPFLCPQNGAFSKWPLESVNLKTLAWCSSVYGKIFQNNDLSQPTEGPVWQKYSQGKLGENMLILKANYQ